MSQSTQITSSQAKSLLITYIKAKMVPMLIGSPGIGKSQIIHNIAQEQGLKIIDLRLSQCDPTDLMGFPHVENGRAGYAPMVTFPIEGDEVPKGYNGWLLFLDEMNSASIAVQAAAYKLVLDRMVGQHHLHSKVFIIAAGNREEDNAIVQPVSTALQSRMAWLELIVDHEEWCDWAISNGVDHRITDFIKFKPSSLYTFKPDHTDKTYACPRTWEFANRLMGEFGTPNFRPLLAGTLSEGVAVEFITFCKVYKSLPKMAEIVASPETIAVPSAPDVLFAISGSLANHVKPENLDKLIKYINRLPSEFQVITLKEARKRNPEILAHPIIQKWTAEFSAAMF